MRRVVLLALFFTILATNAAATASDTCVDVLCTDLTGRVVDPHGNGVADIVVWAQGAGQYREQTTTDSQGRYELHLLNQQAYKGCFLLGGKPDMFYAVGNVGSVCKDATVNIPAAYRVAAQAPKTREFFYADATKPVPMDLEIWANSHTYPAPFHNDPLTWTVTNHPLADPIKRVAQEGVFTGRTITKIGDTYRYLWKTHIVVRPPGVSMVHVDWGLHSVFASMMDCRMLWFGFGMTNVSPANAIPGQLVTVEGVGFGDATGGIYMQIDNGKRAAFIDKENIVSWSPTRIQFIVPTYGSSGYFRVWNSAGLGPPCLGSTYGTPSPRTWLYVDPQKAAASAIPA